MHRVRLAVRENTLSAPDRITAADYIDAIAKLGRSWVVAADGEIVGFASGLNTGNVWALFVHPDHEGRGYGRLLHATVVSWLRSLGQRRLWLTTAPGTRAERFYPSLGWQARGMVDGGDIRFELDGS